MPKVGESRMPIYEYSCLACGDRVELLQKINDPAPLCVKCAQNGFEDVAMVKQVSRSSFVLQGSGWASTGYQ